MRAAHKLTALSMAVAMLLVLPGCTRFGSSEPAKPTAPQSTPAAPSAPVPPKKTWLYPAYTMEKGTKAWGYLSQSGQFVITPRYQSAAPFGPDGLAIIMQGGHYGLIDKSGKLILPPTYDSISPPDSGSGLRVAAGSAGKSVVNSKGTVLFQSAELQGTFSEGLAPMERNGRYGYMREDGTAAIDPQFLSAGPFQNGEAVVKVNDGEYAVIDKSGKRLTTLSYAYVGDLSEGMVVVLDKSTHKYGYMSAGGDQFIPAQFQSAAPFTDGFAVVGLADENALPRMGLINRQGQFVLPPQYGSIEPLGDGLYAVGERTASYRPGAYTRKALFNQDGNQLTDFQFYDMKLVGPNLVCVTDEKLTYVIDQTGAKVTGLPVLTGIGTMRLEGDLVQADVDGMLDYLTRNGQVVWQSDRTVPLTGGGQVVDGKYRPNRFTLVHYPIVRGLPNSEAEARINDLLQTAFLGYDRGRGNPAASASPADDLSVDYTVTQLNHLLAVQATGNDYPIGAAHGMPIHDYFQYDLVTGAAYTLADLFKPGSDYPTRLQSLISTQIALHQSMLDPNPAVSPKQSFAIQTDGLLIAYAPYQIGPYVAGAPTFLIPYGDIMDLVNTNGPLWKSFH